MNFSDIKLMRLAIDCWQIDRPAISEARSVKLRPDASQESRVPLWIGEIHGAISRLRIVHSSGYWNYTHETSHDSDKWSFKGFLSHEPRNSSTQGAHDAHQNQRVDKLQGIVNYLLHI